MGCYKATATYEATGNISAGSPAILAGNTGGVAQGTLVNVESTRVADKNMELVLRGISQTDAEECQGCLGKRRECQFPALEVLTLEPAQNKGGN